MIRKKSKQKIYCYVDETGQDTGGRLFVVSVVITQKDTAKLQQQLEAIEKQSKKRNRKWFHTNKTRRLAFIKLFIDKTLLKKSIFYSDYETKSYLDLTILTTAKAIIGKSKEPYDATIWVDGLKKTERRIFAVGLRKLKVRTRKVRGVRREENNVLIRLADAIAGFVRDSLEGDNKMKKLYKQALGKKIIQKI